MRRGPKADPVRPEVRAYVIRRDGGSCIVATLHARGKITRDVGRCRGDLTAAHVRDRGKGGRSSKRPPSTARHLVACCEGHHIDDPIVDRPDVRDVLDEYLEEREGPDQDDGNRPWETISRVRGREERNAGILGNASTEQDEALLSEGGRPRGA